MISFMVLSNKINGGNEKPLSVLSVHDIEIKHLIDL